MVAEAADAPELLAQCRRLADDGLRAAVQLRESYPGLPVLLLSQYVAPAYAAVLFGGSQVAGLGYLLKERVGRVADFLQTVELVAGGGLVVDPEVVSQLLNSRRGDPVLGRLTRREHEVLALMAKGAANQQIGEQLVISSAAVAKHVANIFSKLDLGPTEDNRRVRAILAYLNR